MSTPINPSDLSALFKKTYSGNSMSSLFKGEYVSFYKRTFKSERDPNELMMSLVDLVSE